MTIAPQAITLEAFLQLPETEPASEYIDGKIIQKPMPKGKHSRLQLQLCNAINDVTEAAQIAYAFPELRCTFANRSIVPDIAVFRWARIPFDPDGEAANDFFIHPDWMIEILSPEQSANQVTRKILHALDYGCEVGWLVDLADRSVLVLQPQQQPVIYAEDEPLPVLTGVELVLSATDLFDWLRMRT